MATLFRNIRVDINSAVPLILSEKMDLSIQKHDFRKIAIENCISKCVLQLTTLNTKS